MQLLFFFFRFLHKQWPQLSIIVSSVLFRHIFFKDYMEDKGVYKCCQRKTEQQKQYGKLGRHIKAQYHKDCQRPVQHQDSKCLENVADGHKNALNRVFFTGL